MFFRNVYYHIYYSISCTFLESAFSSIYFKKLEITRSNKLLAIYRLNSGRDNDLGQVKLETCYIHVLSCYLSCEFLTTQTCLLKYKLVRTEYFKKLEIKKFYQRKYFFFFFVNLLLSISNSFERLFNSLSTLYIIFNKSNFIYFPQCIMQPEKLIQEYKNLKMYPFQSHEILLSILNILSTSKLSYSLFYNQLRGNIRHDGVAFFSVPRKKQRGLQARC